MYLKRLAVGYSLYDTSAGHVPKGEHPCMRMRSDCITYVAFIYVTFSMFNALIVLATVQWKKQVNLII